MLSLYKIISVKIVMNVCVGAGETCSYTESFRKWLSLSFLGNSVATVDLHSNTYSEKQIAGTDNQLCRLQCSLLHHTLLQRKNVIFLELSDQPLGL